MYPPPELRSITTMPGTMPMNASISRRLAADVVGAIGRAAIGARDDGRDALGGQRSRPGRGLRHRRRRGGAEDRREQGRTTTRARVMPEREASSRITPGSGKRGSVA